MPRLVMPVLEEGTLRDQAQPVLRDEGLALRPWRTEDALGLVEAHQDPGIRYWHSRVFASEEEAADWTRQCRERWEAEAGGDWAVTDAASGGLLGRVGLRNLNLAAGFAQITYWVLPAARGQGVAPRAADRVARWALDEVGMHRIELLHSVGNEASCRVAARAGYALEGTLRQVLRHVDGWHDVHLHARLTQDAPTLG